MRYLILLPAFFCAGLTAFSQSDSTVSADTINDSVIATKALDPVVKIEAPVIKPDLSIYPNPATNKVSLQLKGFESGMAKVSIRDMKGKMLRQDSRLLTNGEEEVVMFLSLDPGMYVIEVKENNRVARKKLLIH